MEIDNKANTSNKKLKYMLNVLFPRIFNKFTIGELQTVTFLKQPYIAWSIYLKGSYPWDISEILNPLEITHNNPPT